MIHFTHCIIAMINFHLIFIPMNILHHLAARFIPKLCKIDSFHNSNVYKSYTIPYIRLFAHTMEKLVNAKIDKYVTQFKDHIRDKVLALEFQDTQKAAELIAFVYDYNRFVLERDDMTKRKRVKNSIPEMNRCIAKRDGGEQCTRRRRDDCEFCGTHSKGTPHGIITIDDSVSEVAHQRMEVFAEEIQGIVYYLDRYGNVYKTEDILDNRENPRVVSKWVKQGDVYTIPELGLV